MKGLGSETSTMFQNTFVLTHYTVEPIQIVAKMETTDRDAFAMYPFTLIAKD